VGWTWGEDLRSQAQIVVSRNLQKTKAKKRGVPQICVVSVNRIVDNVIFTQEYLRVVALSNHI
jgi:hypothetical protein